MPFDQQAAPLLTSQERFQLESDSTVKPPTWIARARLSRRKPTPRVVNKNMGENSEVYAVRKTPCLSTGTGQSKERAN